MPSRAFKSPVMSLRSRRALDASLSPSGAAVGGGGGADNGATAIAAVNHGQPTETLALTPSVTVEVDDFAVVSVEAYLEIEENGGFWTIAVLCDGEAVQLSDDSQAIASAVSLSGWGFWALTGIGPTFGPALTSTDRGAHAGLPMGLAFVGGTGTNLVALPDGTHDLAIGVPADLNAGVAGAPGCPDLNVRNAIMQITPVA